MGWVSQVHMETMDLPMVPLIHSTVHFILHVPSLVFANNTRALEGQNLCLLFCSPSIYQGLLVYTGPL
jgi:hypothetical protein